MAKLVWDQTGEHWLETGTDRGVLYPMTASGYGEGVAWSGLRGVDENPEGAEPQDFYADNIKYASILSAEEFKYTINAYTYPDEWRECDGSRSPVAGVYFGQQKRKGFGFTYRTLLANDTASEDDDAYLIHIIYNSLASPSSKSYESVNDSPSAVELSWDATSNPVAAKGYKPVCTITIDTRTLDSAKRTTLENTLYGTENTPATLPTPDALLDLLK